MKAIVNGLEIGWEGITDKEFHQQERLAQLPEIPLGRAPDLRSDEPYARLVPLYRVCPSGDPVKERTRWLCRCTCEKNTLVVVMAQNLGKPGKTEGCGCVFKIRAAENIKRVFAIPDIRKRNAESCRARMIAYQAENKEAVRARAFASVEKVFRNPLFMAKKREKVRERRVARNLDPDIPLSTHRVLIRNATFPLRMHILKVRDDYTCAMCNQRGGKRMAVHHVVPIDASWELVGEPRNLVTLCATCHFQRAHGGSWKTVDAGNQLALYFHAADKERLNATPSEIVLLVRVRLDALGREIGRLPIVDVGNANGLG
ncbi:MAG: HNH endonuclease [Holophaga sp.]|nr:HNH endonuclease [Holophaga sp.]